MADLLLPHGFDTCVIDYLWYETSGYVWELDDYCRPIPDVARWPSSAGGKGFKPVADKVHAMGLKFGIHVMRGTSTYAQEKDCVVKGTRDVRISQLVDQSSGGACPWKPESIGLNMSERGAQAFYDSLYEQYALEWDVDFVKNDCVFRSGRVDEIRAQAASIERVAAHRPIVYSLSPGQSSAFDEELAKADAIADVVHMYRITDDDWDSWATLEVHFDAAAAFASRIGGAGLMGGRSFPDLDMLPIGFVAAPGDEHTAPDHWSHLTRDEQRLQMTLWSIARSPLFFGGDVTALRLPGNANASFVLTLLTNPSVLALNAHSRDNREAAHEGPLRVWTATLDAPDGAFAAAFFNTAAEARPAGGAIAVREVLGAAADAYRACDVLDMWSGAALGTLDVAEGSMLRVAPIAAHGARLVQLSCVA